VTPVGLQCGSTVGVGCYEGEFGCQFDADGAEEFLNEIDSGVGGRSAGDSGLRMAKRNFPRLS
jgi:hypothetical protein